MPAFRIPDNAERDERLYRDDVQRKLDDENEVRNELERLVETHGKVRMQNAVLRWMTEHRDDLSQSTIDSLIAHMESELNCKEGS
jgi:hypothetical protein